jgi:DNA-binding response OmpR family regulator
VTILVIDDDSVIASLVQMILRREGFDVALAEDGETGLQAATAAPPDLVLVDSTMPGLSGAEVVARLKADVATAAIPVVMMSANWNAADGSGADASLRKPFDPPDLIALVRRLLPS